MSNLRWPSVFRIKGPVENGLLYYRRPTMHMTNVIHNTQELALLYNNTQCLAFSVQMNHSFRAWMLLSLSLLVQDSRNLWKDSRQLSQRRSAASSHGLTDCYCKILPCSSYCFLCFLSMSVCEELSIPIAPSDHVG